MKRTTLRDVYGGPGSVKAVPLVDYIGETEQRRGFVARFGDRVVRANNDLVGAFTGIPGQFRDNWRHLRDPVQLRLLLRSLGDESLMTARRRKAIYSIMIWGILFGWAAAGVLLAVTNRSFLVAYQSAFSLFFYSLATAMVLPTPFELLLRGAVDNLGVPGAIFVAAMGKVVGAYLILLLGDRANAGLQELVKRRRLMRSALLGLMRLARRYGHFAQFVLVSIPFMLDTTLLYVFSVLRMNKALFLIVQFCAIVLRSLIYLFAWDAISGLRASFV